MKGQQAAMDKAIVWAIAGNDSAGLAGQVADCNTIAALGAHPCSLVTAVTAQNHDGVAALNPLNAEQVRAQIRALQESLPATAIKLGMLPSAEVIREVAEFIDHYAGPVVCDPVISASKGGDLMLPDAWQSFVKRILPRVTLLTPNWPEAEKLSGLRIRNAEDAEKAASTILDLGVQAVLLKGGHAADKQPDEKFSQDFFTDGEQAFWLSSRRVDTENARGTGCRLASAIAAALAQSHDLRDAVVIGKMAINQGLRQSYRVGAGPGPVEIRHWPDRQNDLPFLTRTPDLSHLNSRFPDCGRSPIGLYPVVDRAEWLERLLPLGVTTAQLRIKDLTGKALEKEIERGIDIAHRHRCRLFINDHWRIAIDKGAYGVHLGQEDLDEAHLSTLHVSGLRLGVSTHSYYEVSRAHAIQPSYIAVGPVYATTSKQMPWIPKGLENLAYWVNTLIYPVVAIGGITEERAPLVAGTGVSGVALISAITEANDPEQATRDLLVAVTADTGST